ncbi:MAG: fibro-slime domain-containing protein [Phycisphaerales bacterium]
MSSKSTRNALMTALGLATAAGLVFAPGAATSAVASGDNNFADLPDEITLTGVVRDFRARNETNGHPDFEMSGSTEAGYGHYVGMVQAMLDSDKKPVAGGRNAHKISVNWTDSQNRPINPALYNPQLGDKAGSWSKDTYTGWITSPDQFGQWFRTTPGVNTAKPLSITLHRVDGTNRYVFDDREDPAYSGHGFFPINNDLFGNYASTGKNFHFTYELATDFVYLPGQGQVFTFRGDDDVWVFVNDQLVIDLGGVHSAATQTIELDRLTNLRPNQVNSLRFFFAERHTTQSNFRIETTINLRTAKLPNTSALYD